MFKVKEKCPYCQHEFETNIFRFNATLKCSKCHKKIYIETRTGFYLILLVFFMMISTQMNEGIKQLLPGMPELVYVVVLFFVMLAAVFLVMLISCKLFGFTSIYRIRSDEYYTSMARAADQRRMDKKANKKNKKK